MTDVANASAAAASAASRCAIGNGRTLRCAAMARETYSDGTILSSATATPAVLRMTSRLRVRYWPSGPSASMSTKSAATPDISEGTSVHAFDDGLALEGGDRSHRADRIGQVRYRPGHPDRH